jgi:rfaE bifunctional protein nucleotidyltransferase chain/domain
MQYINNTIEELDICNNSSNKIRNNSLQINYLNKVNDKPWGKEYLAYQNKQIGIWILHVNKDQETSLHCHFKKDTILINISGGFKINLYNHYKILNLFECLYVPRNTFHGIHSYTDKGVLMEIEVYTEHIEYTDKNDLLRIKDMYSRDKTKYETSITERDALENEIMLFDCPNTYYIDNTKISIFTLNPTDKLKNNYDKVIMLDGCIYSDGKKISAGSIINIEGEFSFLTDTIKILCLSNIDYKYLNKIIYSKSQLTDYLFINNLNQQRIQSFVKHHNQSDLHSSELMSDKGMNHIGLTSGCFDILHEGHIKNLKICKQNCNHLFVCLSSDNQIKRLKGELRPINNLKDRVNMLIHFDFIDLIILYDETDDELETELDNIMNIVKPDIWFKGNDYNKENIFKKHPGLKNIKLIDLIEGKSTTNIIKKITS